MLSFLVSSKIRIALFIVAIFFIGFIFGFTIRYQFLNKNNSDNDKQKFCDNSLESVRLGGYKFINPLVICDISTNKSFPGLSELEKKLNSLIKQYPEDKISIYFQNLDNGEKVLINGEEKFFTASLGKVPNMMAFFKLSETNPDILTRKIRYLGGHDLNESQEIKPKETIKEGEIYTVEDLIKRMIKYSDNNALGVLIKIIDKELLDKTYEDVYKDMDKSLIVSTDILDFITTIQYSLFLRALYNGTYLNKDLSEKALQILNETDFEDGLVAGVPKGITVSHKYGLFNFLSDTGEILSKEFHDCGIIYYPQNPYLLCVMTKISSGNTLKAENIISDISSLVYKEINNQK
jgi:beta-lactamase class A